MNRLYKILTRTIEMISHRNFAITDMNIPINYQLFEGRKLCVLLCLILFTSCDKVYNEVTPQSPPMIPQATTEVFKQMYPDVKEFIFQPLESGKTWQTYFSTSTGNVLSVVDYDGEIIDLNPLLGTSKTLPAALKQYVYNKYANAQIINAYDVMKSSTQTDGYKITIQTDKNTTLNLFFDGNNVFMREEIPQPEKISMIVFTSTESINFDGSVPIIVKQFVSNNQIKSASIIIYGLTNNTYKIIFNFKERPNGTLLTSETILSSTGNVLSWVSLIENEVAYKSLKTNELSPEIVSYLNASSPNWQLDYALTKVNFGRNKNNYINIKSSKNEYLLIKNDELNKSELSLTITQILAEKDLPQNVKNTLNNSFVNGIFIMAKVIYEPVSQAVYQINTTPKYYYVEIKQGTDRYAIRLSGKGEILYQYKML